MTSRRTSIRHVSLCCEVGTAAFEYLVIDVGDDDMGAAFKERFGRSQADSSATASNEGGLPFQATFSQDTWDLRNSDMF